MGLWSGSTGWPGCWGALRFRELVPSSSVVHSSWLHFSSFFSRVPRFHHFRWGKRENSDDRNKTPVRFLECWSLLKNIRISKNIRKLIRVIRRNYFKFFLSLTALAFENWDFMIILANFHAQSIIQKDGTLDLLLVPSFLQNVLLYFLHFRMIFRLLE